MTTNSSTLLPNETTSDSTGNFTEMTTENDDVSEKTPNVTITLFTQKMSTQTMTATSYLSFSTHVSTTRRMPSHENHLSDEEFHDFKNKCLEFISETKIHPSSSPTRELLEAFSTLNIIALEIGLFANLIGIAICKSTDMGKTEFGNYLNICLIITVPLMIFSHIVSCSHLQDLSSGIFTGFVEEAFCHYVQAIYMYLDNVHGCSMLLLCFNRIRNQRVVDIELTQVDALRWPFMGNCFFALFLCAQTSTYATIRIKVLGPSQCLLRILKPFCHEYVYDQVFSSIPIIIDALALVLVLVLLAEIFLKKRRWKRHMKYWEKKRNSGVVSADDLEMNDLRSVVSKGRQMIRKKSALSSASYTSLAMTLGRRTLGILTQDRSLTSTKKGHFKDSRTPPSYITTLRSTDYHDKETMDEFDAFYEQEMLPENTTTESRTTLTLALMVSMFLFRLPRDLVVCTYLKTELETALQASVQPRMVLAFDLLHQFGLILPVPLFCLMSSAYMQATLDWLFERHLNQARAELSPGMARTILDKFRRQPTTVFVEDQWADKADIHNNLRIQRATQTLTHYMATSNHNLDVLDVLENCNSEIEPAFLEKFMIDISAETATLMESRMSACSTPDSDEDSDSREKLFKKVTKESAPEKSTDPIMESIITIETGAEGLKSEQSAVQSSPKPSISIIENYIGYFSQNS